MAVVWNGYETGKKIYKTHPDGLPAQYNAFRQVLRQWDNAKIDSGMRLAINLHKTPENITATYCTTRG